jgi:hypothetical protein
MPNAYPNIASVAPHLVLRLTEAVEALDADRLHTLDADVRRFVTELVAAPNADTSSVLAELAQLYRDLRLNSEARRSEVQRLMGEHRRAQAGLLAYRSSGATSLKA